MDTYTAFFFFSHSSAKRVPAEKSHSGRGRPGVDYVDLVLGRQRILGSARGKLVKLGPGRHCQGGSSEQSLLFLFLPTHGRLI